jgi:7-cyano-7-deazaguanine synthase
LAASVAVDRGADEVQYGATLNDQNGYPDCRPDFAGTMSSALQNAYGVKVTVPFRMIEKSEIVHMAFDLGLDPSQLWSCYTPIGLGGGECGSCDACVRKREALK